jgi:Leucine-rich repeat (LRR) protein
VTGGDLPSDKKAADVNAVRIYGTNVYLPDVSSVAERFPNIDFYDLGFLKLKHISRKRLAPFKNKLVWISFFGNEIMKIEPDTFSDLTKVYKIILASNKLQAIDRDLFAKNPKLSELWLQNNELTALPEGIFRNNRELKEIFASDNKLHTIDINFAELPNFSKIDLRNNECIDKWCDTSNYCGTGSKDAMQKLIYKKC